MFERFANILIVIVSIFSILTYTPINSVKAETGATVRSCEIWQTKIRINEKYKTIVVKAFSESQNGLDRFATVKHILDFVDYEFDFDKIEVFLFAPGTKPYREYLNSEHAVAHVSYMPNPKLLIGQKQHWIGGYSIEKTPVKMTEADKQFGPNPMFDYEPLDEWSIRNFAYKKGECEIDKVFFRWDFDHPDLK